MKNKNKEIQYLKPAISHPQDAQVPNPPKGQHEVSVHDKVGILELDFNVRVSSKQFVERTLTRMEMFEKRKERNLALSRERLGTSQISNSNISRENRTKRSVDSGKREIQMNPGNPRLGGKSQSREPELHPNPGRMDLRVREFYSTKETRLSSIKKESRESSRVGEYDKNPSHPKINKRSQKLTRTYDHMMEWHENKLKKWNPAKQHDHQKPILLPQ